MMSDSFTAEELLLEISRLRENLHRIYNENKRITKELLVVSIKLDESINDYVKLLQNENRS